MIWHLVHKQYGNFMSYLDNTLSTWLGNDMTCSCVVRGSDMLRE